MQIFGMLIFLAVWLLILWIGSIALESTGLERSRARFQALSALSGTGFTTSQAEAIVEHPKRRRIATYLIFIGNTGIIALLLLVIIYARDGISTPSTSAIIITVVILLAIGLSIWLGLIDRITNGVLKLSGKEQSVTGITGKIIYQAGDHAVVRLHIGKKSELAGRIVSDTGIAKSGIRILALERDSTVISPPSPSERLSANDSLLCYGKLATVTEVPKQ